MIRTVVASENVLAAVELKPSPGDAIGEPADDPAEIRVWPEILVEAVEAKYDVIDTTIAVGNTKGGHDAAEVRDSDGKPRAIRQGKELRPEPFVPHAGPSRIEPKAAEPEDDPENT